MRRRWFPGAWMVRWSMGDLTARGGWVARGGFDSARRVVSAMSVGLDVDGSTRHEALAGRGCWSEGARMVPRDMEGPMDHERRTGRGGEQKEVASGMRVE